MTETNDLARLAAAINLLRPDWSTRSLQTFLARHAQRPYRDLAVAMAWIAADPDTRTPARLDEPGPWWQPTYAASEAKPTSQPPKFGHQCLHGWAIDSTNCPHCRNDATKKNERP